MNERKRARDEVVLALLREVPKVEKKDAEKARAEVAELKNKVAVTEPKKAEAKAEEKPKSKPKKAKADAKPEPEQES
jgi:hypothetical protein